MGLFSIINNLLGRNTDQSRNTAKDRLRLVLMHDRSDIPATMMEAIRTEMVQVLSKYVEIDQAALEVLLEKEAGSIGLVLNIPIKRVKTEAEAAEALAAMLAVQEAQNAANHASAVVAAATAEIKTPSKASKSKAAAAAVAALANEIKEAKETEAAASAD
jgi:cell division topological specificity factor